MALRNGIGPAALPFGHRITYPAAKPKYPVAGDIYYDTFNMKLRRFDGTVWLDALSLIATCAPIVIED